MCKNGEVGVCFEDLNKVLLICDFDDSDCPAVLSSLLSEQAGGGTVVSVQISNSIYSNCNVILSWTSISTDYLYLAAKGN